MSLRKETIDFINSDELKHLVKLKRQVNSGMFAELDGTSIYKISTVITCFILYLLIGIYSYNRFSFIGWMFFMALIAPSGSFMASLFLCIPLFITLHLLSPLINNVIRQINKFFEHKLQQKLNKFEYDHGINLTDGIIHKDVDQYIKHNSKKLMSTIVNSTDINEVNEAKKEYIENYQHLRTASNRGLQVEGLKHFVDRAKNNIIKFNAEYPTNLKLKDWLHKGFKKSNIEIELVLHAEVIQTHIGHFGCPVGRNDIEKWCIVTGYGRKYVVAKSKDDKYYVQTISDESYLSKFSFPDIKEGDHPKKRSPQQDFKVPSYKELQDLKKSLNEEKRNYKSKSSQSPKSRPSANTSIGKRDRTSSNKRQNPASKKPRKSSRRPHGRKYDWEEINKKKIENGRLGELLVLQRLFEIEEEFEKSNTEYEHVSKTKGDGLGYDIYILNDQVGEVYIEVKTTTGDFANDLYMSVNEVKTMERHGDRYWLYRVYNFDPESVSGKIIAIKGAERVRGLFEFHPDSFIVAPKIGT